jgi:hypothetical protein
MSDLTDPQDHGPAFPTQEGGAVVPEHILSGTKWSYLLVLEVPQIGPWVMEALGQNINAACFEYMEQGQFNVFHNPISIAVHFFALPEAMKSFVAQCLKFTKLANRGRETRYVLHTTYPVREHE